VEGQKAVAVDEKADLEQVNALYSLLSNRYASKVEVLLGSLYSRDNELIIFFNSTSLPEI
jgi:hypothetical protein